MIQKGKTIELKVIDTDNNYQDSKIIKIKII
jgi:hypothetical protein